LAAELEETTQESSELIQSSGGVFEIEYKGKLIYSKKASGRFPDEGEVLRIIHAVDSGIPLSQAQEEAAKGHKNPSFAEWLGKMLHKRA